jgi:hypothetical protein
MQRGKVDNTNALMMHSAFSTSARCPLTFPLPGTGAPFALAVSPEVASGRELPELVTNHVLRDIDRHVATAIVHADGVTDHLRKNGGVARPGLQDTLITSLIHDLDACEQLGIDVWTFFD